MYVLVCYHNLGPYIPIIVDASTSTTTQKPRDKWTEEDRRRIQYNLKAKNIITSALEIDEYFRVSNCSLSMLSIAQNE